MGISRSRSSPLQGDLCVGPVARPLGARPHGEAPGRAAACFIGEVPVDVLAKHVAVLLTARELATLCMARPSWWQAVAQLIRELAAAQHGVHPVEISCLRDLRCLEEAPRSSSIHFAAPKFASASGVRLLSGSHLEYPIYVGGDPKMVTTAMNPPAAGDTFEVPMKLRRGRYRIVISGWRNPYHGVLDIFLDGRPISSPQGLDWGGAATMPHSFAIPEDVEVERTGLHFWRFETSRTHAVRGNGFWICLDRLWVEPVAGAEPLGESGRQWHGQKDRPSRWGCACRARRR